MGLLDGILSQVVGSSAVGGGAQGSTPLSAILGSLAGSLGHGSSTGGLGGMLNGALAGNTANNAPGSSGMGGAAAAGGLILSAVMAMVQQQGGIGAVLGKLQGAGLGSQTASWVGTGANQPVSPTDLHNALGHDAIGGLAAKLGVSPQQAGGVLSQVLPELINQLTPQGTLPDNHADLLSKGLEMLRNLQQRPA